VFGLLMTSSSFLPLLSRMPPLMDLRNAIPEAGARGPPMNSGPTGRAPSHTRARGFGRHVGAWVAGGLGCLELPVIISQSCKIDRGGVS
jgi:hypothetical protein